MNVSKKMPEGWQEVKLSQLVEIDKINLGASTSLEYEFSYISLSNVSRGSIDENLPLLTFREAPSRARRVVNHNDILFSTVRPNLEGHAQIGKGMDNLIASTGFAVLTPKDQVFSDYIYQYLYSCDMKNQIYSLVVGSNYPAVNSSDVANFKIRIPKTRAQQKAIVELLSTWDKAIDTIGKLLKLKVEVIESTRRSLISKQIPNITLGRFVNLVVRSERKPTKSYSALGLRSHFKGTFHRTIEDPSKVSMDTLYRVKEDDLIVNITFAWEGAISIVVKDDEECYVSHRFPTYEIIGDKAMPCFVKQLIKSSRMKYDLANISPGGAGRNRVLNKKDFLNMPMWLPDLKTQEYIGTYLSSLDKEIHLLEQLKVKYNRQKKGLMQKLFTGEWRISEAVSTEQQEFIS